MDSRSRRNMQCILYNRKGCDAKIIQKFLARKDRNVTRKESVRMQRFCAKAKWIDAQMEQGPFRSGFTGKQRKSDFFAMHSKHLYSALQTEAKSSIPRRYWDELYENAFNVMDAVLFENFFEDQAETD